MSDATLKLELAKRPRLTGALFAALVLLLQAAAVMAGGEGGGGCPTCAGP